MDTTALPDNPSAFAGATWEQIRPHYDDLARAPLDRATAPSWLRAWSHLEELLTEAANRAYIAHTADTRDVARAEEERRFAADIWPQAEARRVRLSARLLEVGYDPPDLATTLRRFANRRALFRDENAAPLAALAALETAYQGLMGALTVDWDGAARTRAQVRPFALAPDRATRERAFRAQVAPLIARRDAFEDLFDRQLALRQTIARNASFRDYRDYAHRDKGRFDYTPDDCIRFHAAVATAVVPAVRRRLARRRRLLGLATLRPWDTPHDPLGRPPLAPFADVAGLIGPAETILTRLDPALGAQVGMLREEGLLDLASRPGKAPGGYSIALPWRKRPFVFMNAAGTARDVEILLHELGHAAHSLARFAAQPLFWQRDPGLEMNELAALGLELLAAPHLGREAGGYYAPADARRARAEQLDTLLALLPQYALLDAWQQWVYTSPDGADRDARDAAWRRLSARFQPDVAWDGLEAEQAALRHGFFQLYLDPFYQIEYGFAQVGALQLWRASLEDQAGTVARYRAALALGATRPLPDLYAAAGVRFGAGARALGVLVALVEAHLEALERT